MRISIYLKKLLGTVMAATALLSPPGVLSAETLDFQQAVLPFGSAAVRINPDELQIISADDAAAINASMQEHQEESDSLIRNNAENYYYYDQLDPTARQIYDVMMTVAKDPATLDNYGLMMTDLDPESEEYYFAMAQAYFAMTYDHPELFWLYNMSESSINFLSEAMSFNGLYLVYYGLVDPFEKYEEQMTAFNEATDAFLADIDRTKSDYEIVRQIHDKLVDLVTYDKNVFEHMEENGRNLAHTAYGALVENSEGEKNTAVCDGYSLAFEYLLQQCGIDCVVIAGDAGPDDYTVGGHAWNMVKINNTWYEVDTTWDDAGTREMNLTEDMEGYAYRLEALHNPEYRDKIQHFLFLLSTEEFRNFTVSDEYSYVTNDRQFRFSMVNDNVHIRYEDNGTLDPYQANPSVIAMAPVADFHYQ